ncbi:MAG: CAP domain-containing protein [Erysipelotrichaceae bacterium]|nr:CAP domain-containing protein [Erysipelotrichaceae bacterium]
MKLLLKKKYTMVIIVMIVVLVIIALVYLFIQSNQPVLVLVSDYVEVEYGEAISLEASFYLDSEQVDEDIITATEVSLNDDLEALEYPSVGEYVVTLTYKNETKSVTISVNDTIAPEFKDFKDNFEYTKDCGPEDFVSNFEADDLSEVTITVDDGDVDYTKTGEYIATIKASDEYGNETEKEVTITIIDPTIKLNKTSYSMIVDESLVLTVTITGKDNTATFKSSDTSVATVDQNGKVTAQKAGSTTIAATANGVEDTCKITVKAQTTSSSSDGSSSSDSSSSSSNSSSSNGLKTSVASEIVSLTNKQRTNNGLSSLTVSAKLTQAAQLRAKEIYQSFSHTRPNGSSCSTVFDEYSYSYSACGENIIYGYNSASSAVTAWMNSSGHRANILNENFTEIGVGVYSVNGVYYCVQLFGRPE